MTIVENMENASRLMREATKEINRLREINAELLEALQKTVDRFSSREVQQAVVPGGLLDQCLTIMKAAIAKAEGR